MQSPPTKEAAPRRNRRGSPVVALLAAALLISLAIGAGYLLRPKVYTATATLYVARQRPTLLENPPPVDEGEFAIFRQTQAALVKSRRVLNAALRDARVQNLAVLREEADPLAWLEKEVKVDFDRGPEILSISLSGQDPEQLAPLVNAIKDAYLTEIVGKERRAMEDREKQLREIAKLYEDKVASIRKSMLRLREQAGAGEEAAIEVKREFARMEASEAAKELVSVLSELRRKRAELAGPERNKEPATLREKLAGVLDEDPAVQRGLKEVARIEADLAERKTLLKDAEKDATYQKLQAALDAARRSLEARREAVAKGLREKADADQQARVQGIRERVAHLESLEKLLEKDLERLSREAKSTNVLALDLEEFEPDLAKFQGMANRLNKQAELLAVEMRAPPRMYSLEDEAIVTGPR